MVKSQTVRSINKLVVSMSSLIYCIAAIAGSTREKNGYYKAPPPLMDILLKYVFERTCPNYWWNKSFTSILHA